jgi:hypothetical protein
MKRLRVFLAALLLVPALISNANAFTTETDPGLGRPQSALCWIYWNGWWFFYEC